MPNAEELVLTYKVARYVTDSLLRVMEGSWLSLPAPGKDGTPPNTLTYSIR